MNDNHLYKSLLLVFLLPAFIISLTFISCSQGKAPAAEKRAVEKPEAIATGSELTWEQKWENLIKAARKEGKISIYSGLESDSVSAIRKNFGEKYGIELQVVTGKSSELDPKIFAERQNGLYIPDVYVEGPTSPILVYKPRGILEPLDKIIFRPDVLDEKLWSQGFGPYFDKTHYLGGGTSTVQPAVIINTNMVSPGELTSYMDLLKPKWKGKILLGDPTVEGGAASTMGSSLTIMGEDYIRQLADQVGATTRDKRLVVEWVARGKYPIAFGAGTSIVIEFINQSVPVEMISFKEGHGTTASGVVVVFDHAPNPNAAKLFANWLLTREAQQVYSVASGKMSRRLDVSSDHLREAQRMKPGVKYILNDEEYYLKRPQLDEIVRKHYLKIR